MVVDLQFCCMRVLQRFLKQRPLEGSIRVCAECRVLGLRDLGFREWVWDAMQGSST